ncbi:54S ribosomal protein L4 mitochondrial [Cladophialophora chaetospira]|uniref:Large ribosomal subunit protein uL29m n=1 Tax=Cladophialophora chaetospira TaxID=386627 RepID=A0AA38XAF5_9EURO|nr:54S ribosomal protein L4 mitochondrial [Cladophialophora chaetospira]
MASLGRPLFATPSTANIPLFLAPAFARPPPSSFRHTAQFSTSTPLLRASATRKQAGIEAATSGKPNWSLKARPKIDRNKERGVSAIRRTGPRSTRGLWKYPLPVPVARDQRGIAAEYPDTQDHGLWGFFDESRQAMLEPDEESSHGRAWEYKELAGKSFEDLHKLYWVCVKEKSRTLTREKERKRLRAGYGQLESEERIDVIKRTMGLIREVLIDRQLSFNQAQVLINEKYVDDIFYEPGGNLVEDDAATVGQEDVGLVDQEDVSQPSSRPAPQL